MDPEGLGGVAGHFKEALTVEDDVAGLATEPFLETQGRRGVQVDTGAVRKEGFRADAAGASNGRSLGLSDEPLAVAQLVPGIKGGADGDDSGDAGRGGENPPEGRLEDFLRPEFRNLPLELPVVFFLRLFEGRDAGGDIGVLHFAEARKDFFISIEQGKQLGFFFFGELVREIGGQEGFVSFGHGVLSVSALIYTKKAARV